jgi:hypothetical protein
MIAGAAPTDARTGFRKKSRRHEADAEIGAGGAEPRNPHGRRERL